MPQLRKDPLTGRWVIVANEKPILDFAVEPHIKSSKTCPFCPGNEAMTPTPILSYPKKGGKAGEWQLRVFPNKFPALKIEEKPEKSAEGIYDRVGGFGAHEVIVENPDHYRELPDLSDDEAELVFRAYRERCLDLRKDPRLRSILIFKNYGREAGASMEHPHAQLIALPIVPSRVQSEMKGAEKHSEYADRCFFCDMLKQEEDEKSRIVHQEGGFTAFSPFAARFPFETWVMPSTHASSFDRLDDVGLRQVARMVKRVLGRLREKLGDPSYNYMIHTAPIGGKETEGAYYHWHIEIIPHLTRVAGFELGSGFYINPTPPELAAERLRI